MLFGSEQEPRTSRALGTRFAAFCPEKGFALRRKQLESSGVTTMAAAKRPKQNQ
jgi:hypothetical protein